MKALTGTYVTRCETTKNNIGLLMCFVTISMICDIGGRLDANVIPRSRHSQYDTVMSEPLDILFDRYMTVAIIVFPHCC